MRERRGRGERGARLGRAVEARADRLDRVAAPAGGSDRDGAGRTVQQPFAGRAGHDAAEPVPMRGADDDQLGAGAVGDLVQSASGGLRGVGDGLPPVESVEDDARALDRPQRLVAPLRHQFGRGHDVDRAEDLRVDVRHDQAGVRDGREPAGERNGVVAGGRVVEPGDDAGAGGLVRFGGEHGVDTSLRIRGRVGRSHAWRSPTSRARRRRRWRSPTGCA